MKNFSRRLLVSVTPLLLSAAAFAAEEGAGSHDQLTHIQGIPVIAIVAGILGGLTLVALAIGVVAGWLTSREDWPEQGPHQH